MQYCQLRERTSSHSLMQESIPLIDIIGLQHFMVPPNHKVCFNKSSDVNNY